MEELGFGFGLSRIAINQLKPGADQIAPGFPFCARI
jgi:hypothetical protein